MRTICIAASMLMAAAGAGAEEFCVGQNQGSTHGTLLTAIDAAESNGPEVDTIYVSTEVLHQNQQLVIANHSVTFVGVLTCDLREPGPLVPVRGNGSTSVVSIDSNDFHEVRFSRLTILGGGDDGTGGGIDVRGSAVVFLDNTVVRNNRAALGGGIYVQRPSLGSSGGIVHLLPGSTIRNNEAEFGGGIALERGTLRAHALNVRIENNTATVNGGGVAVLSGEFVTGKFVDTAVNGTANGVVIDGNSAGGAGGGVAVQGNTSFLFGSELIINNNVAIQGGGGIYADAGGYVGMQRDYANAPSTFNCPPSQMCSRVTNNRTGTLGAGGALLLSASRAFISQTLVRGNQAETGGAVLATNASTLRFESSVIARNLCTRVGPYSAANPFCTNIEIDPTSNARLAYTTLITPRSTWNNGFPEHVVKRAGGLLDIFSSISDRFGVVNHYGPFSQTRLDCMLGTFGGGMAPAASVMRSLQVTDVRFVDVVNDDYRLAADSPGIDFCDTAQVTPTVNDIALNARGVDLPGVSGPFGTHDLGASERAVLPEVIFLNGFE